MNIAGCILDMKSIRKFDVEIAGLGQNLLN